jgi:hypothetical protein
MAKTDATETQPPWRPTANIRTLMVHCNRRYCVAQYLGTAGAICLGTGTARPLSLPEGPEDKRARVVDGAPRVWLTFR